MTRFLAPDLRCTAWWYADRAQMLPYGGPADLDDREFLEALELRAGALAAWHQVPPSQLPEYGRLASAWPEWAWDTAADAMAQAAAEDGTYGPEFPLTRVVNCRTESCDVLIDRTTPWGNPYRIGWDGDRGQVIAAYEAYLASRADLTGVLGRLRGLRLGCHCAPLPCHGDVLTRLADALGDDELGNGIPPWCLISRGGVS